MSKVADQITNMRKTQNKRETDRRELADVVEQEKLIEIKGGWEMPGEKAFTRLNTSFPYQAADRRNFPTFRFGQLSTTSETCPENWRFTPTVSVTILPVVRKLVSGGQVTFSPRENAILTTERNLTPRLAIQ